MYIGMDHFAMPNDELAVAQRQGRLHRNFQGYAPMPNATWWRCGVSAIGAVGATYSQNAKTLDAYYERIDRASCRWCAASSLTMDDLLRRMIIQMLMCNFELSHRSRIEQAYPITFATYFADRNGTTARTGGGRPADDRCRMDHGDAEGPAADPQYLHGVRSLSRHRRPKPRLEPARYSQTVSEVSCD